MRGFLIVIAVLLLALPARPCEWVTGFFYQVTALHGKVVGGHFGLINFRWLRQSIAREGAVLKLYQYRRPIHSREDMPFVKSIRAGSDGEFDFGSLPKGHYTLIVEIPEWNGAQEWFDVEIVERPRPTGSVLIDVSPVHPDCTGGHEFIVRAE